IAHLRRPRWATTFLLGPTPRPFALGPNTNEPTTRPFAAIPPRFSPPRAPPTPAATSPPLPPTPLGPPTDAQTSSTPTPSLSGAQSAAEWPTHAHNALCSPHTAPKSRPRPPIRTKSTIPHTDRPLRGK